MSALRLGRCPRCNGTVTFETFSLSEPCVVNGRPDRQGRFAQFYACNECEWIEEVKKGKW
jgi:uncharacterized protein with PIN domain